MTKVRPPPAKSHYNDNYPQDCSLTVLPRGTNSKQRVSHWTMIVVIFNLHMSVRFLLNSDRLIHRTVVAAAAVHSSGRLKRIEVRVLDGV